MPCWNHKWNMPPVDGPPTDQPLVLAISDHCQRYGKRKAESPSKIAKQRQVKAKLEHVAAVAPVGNE
jgi:hypothetical protein